MRGSQIKQETRTSRSHSPTSNRAGSVHWVFTIVVYLAFLACASCVDPPKAEPKTITVMVAVLDLSPSTVVDLRCDELSARVRQVLGTPGVKRLDVMAVGTGEGPTGMEPIILVRWSRWDPKGKLYEQPGQADAAREAWAESVRATCHEALRATRTSPIFAAIKRGAESIRAHCKEIEGRRERCDRQLLFINSDLRENGERSITERLVNGTRGRAGANARPLPRLDLGGVELTVCGVSDTRLGDGDVYISASVLSAVWTEVLGPSTPAFDASCPIDQPLPNQRNGANEVRP